MVGITAEHGLNYRKLALEARGKLPPFSPILNRLMASLASEDVQVSELADWIEKDTVLAGHVLRLVNSVVFSLRGMVSSVRHAIAIMGLIKLRNLVLGLSVSRMWQNLKTPLGWSMRRFNLHATASSVLADLLAQHLPCDFGEGAFTAGLLHDIGELLIAIGVPQQYLEIRRLQQDGFGGQLDFEQFVLGATHADLSGDTLRAWNLPAPIHEAAAAHHTVEAPGAGQWPAPLAWIVRLADELVDMEEEPALEHLRASGVGERAERIYTTFQAEFSVLRDCF